ncbi:helix-turn-helix domain-containing protein [Tenacibaculum sp. 190524A02b]|uniref:helix-turn-helix domain-containing protein n=1 Tax=Tenacibaculum vairaonense TaxID=3137860 RepID=UPI0031FAC5A0
MVYTAEDIKNIRKKHSLTQEKLANLLGVSWRTIQNYERGHTIPKSKNTLFRVLFEKLENKSSDLSTSLEEPELKYHTDIPSLTKNQITFIENALLVHEEQLFSESELIKKWLEAKLGNNEIEVLKRVLENRDKKRTKS